MGGEAVKRYQSGSVLLCICNRQSDVAQMTVQSYLPTELVSRELVAGSNAVG